jgi:hypothetical protein
MINLKCYIKLSPNGASNIPGLLIAFVPSPRIRNRTCGTNTLDTISTDGIVKLESFDKGKLYQIPLDQITIVDNWEETKQE